ncbi:MAG: DNA primase [Campylobacterales bacterium]|nr:DNA primase [Campylobacterales bacterium]
MITKQSIENLKSHLEIVDVISQYLELKKTGANFKACCPFHGEQTPSFVVSPAKQIYHCFGCGVGGDALKFVMEYEKLSYPEAIEKLASIYNISLSYEDSGKKQDTKLIQKVNEYYQKKLFQNQVALQYLQQRGVSEFSIEKFEIGFAASSNDTINFLKSNFLNLADAKEYGIIDSGTNGLYARFIDRIIFPIYTITGTIVGFGGRTISGHNAKYVNSPQTKYFNKSRLLYGYHLAKESIYKKNQIIVTEGYLDVVMLHQAGFSNAVATLGTALTQEHIPLLKRAESQVIVAYDGDKAGLNAAYKASMLLSHSQINGGVVIFQDGLDPAEMVQNKQINQLNELLSHPTPFIPFVLDYIVNQFYLDDPSQKQDALIQANSYLKTLTPIFQEEYSSYLAQKLNINKKLVQVNQFRGEKKANVHLTSIDIAELSIIKTAIEDVKFYKLICENLTLEMFQTHFNEFNILLKDRNDPRLHNILLDERIKVYDQEHLMKQMVLIMIPFYTKKLQQLNYDKTIGFKQKTKDARKLKDILMQLKHGKLVGF